MGQENAQILSQQHELQKQYIIESRQKESNLIFLSHRQTHKSFVLRELIYTEQRQYNHYLKRIPFFKSYNTPLLTRFISKFASIQGRNILKTNASALSISTFIFCGNILRILQPPKSTQGPSKSALLRKHKYEKY